MHSWSRSEAKGSIDYAITEYKNNGQLNNAVKLCMLKYANKHQLKQQLTVQRILFDMSEKLTNFANDAEMLF